MVTKIEYEVNSLGKRLQGIRYNSTDSLSWTPFSRTRYYYTGNPQVSLQILKVPVLSTLC
jgi:hypothetical protein